MIEEMLAAREFGRVVASPALCAGILGAHVAARAGASDLVERILGGHAAVGLMIAVPAKPGGASEVNLVEARGAELLLYWNESGAGLVARDVYAAATVHSSLDDSVCVERASRATAPPLAWVPVEDAPIPARAALLICAQMVGIAEGVKDLAVAYAKLRQQFGQPIGAFQAIKHACAEMAVQCEVAYAQTFFAALAVNSGRSDGAFQLAAAGLLTADAALRNARMGIQIHGGVGFTADCRAHRYLKRAHLLNWLATPAHSLRRQCLATDPVYG
jgi:hypothetical protein